MRACRVSDWGTQPIRPLLVERGTTENLWVSGVLSVEECGGVVEYLECVECGYYLNGEVPLKSLRVTGEERVDQREELHHALVLPQVLVALQVVRCLVCWWSKTAHLEQKHVLLPSAPLHAELPGPLLAGDDLERRVDRADAADVLVERVLVQTPNSAI